MSPNPSDGGLTLKNTSAGGQVRITLLDMVGRTVHTERIVITTGVAHTLSLHGRLTPGVYSLQVDAAGGRWEQRVVVR